MSEIHVNSALSRELRRVPFQNMIYVADGPSDVPAWSVVKGNGGMTFGVYQRGSRRQFEQISALQRDGRIHAFGEADYRPESTAWLWLTTEVRRIADRIVDERDAALRRAVRPPARHIADAAELARAVAAVPGEPGPPEIQANSATPAAEEIRAAVRRQLEADGRNGDAAEDDPAGERQERVRFPGS